MITKIKNFFNNLDGDQKAILKSTSTVTAVVLIASALIGSYIGILAIPVHALVTGLLSNDIKRTKKYIFDKRSNKRFKITTPERFMYAWLLLVVATFIFAQNLKDGSIATPFVVLVPTFVINAIAFKLKLPISAIALGSIRESPTPNTAIQFDSTPIKSSFPEMGDAVQDPAFSSSPSNIYHVPTPRRD